MEPFEVHEGLVVPLDRSNVDTDQIIPKQFLKRIEKTGFGEFLFYDWRYTGAGEKVASFTLNQPQFARASILVADRNFGCGSSREHAVWALAQFGFRAVIAPSFADIFANNSVKNGLLTVVLDEDAVRQLMQKSREGGYRLTVDLKNCSVRGADGFSATFSIDSFTRHCLLHGLDDIGLTLEHEADIAAYEARHPAS